MKKLLNVHVIPNEVSAGLSEGVYDLRRRIPSIFRQWDSSSRRECLDSE
jgi:hypothetical protein